MPAARPGWRSRGEGAEGGSGGAVPAAGSGLAARTLRSTVWRGSHATRGLLPGSSSSRVF